MKQIRIGIIDYGMGNLQSVRNALEHLGCEVKILNTPESIIEADALILPGVGAFGEAMSNLQKRNLVEPLQRAVLDQRKPFLGICL